MFMEFANVHQRPGEPKRRWFQSPQEDLIVWYDEQGAILGFQLCYDRVGKERALTWRQGKGFAHDRVDDGEEGGLTYKRTAILVPDGRFDAPSTLKKLQAATGQLPQDVFEFVCAKLREYAARASGI